LVSEFERLKKMEQSLRERGTAFRAADRLARHGAHEPRR
jgi:hypothetical protein